MKDTNKKQAPHTIFTSQQRADIFIAHWNNQLTKELNICYRALRNRRKLLKQFDKIINNTLNDETYNPNGYTYRYIMNCIKAEIDIEYKEWELVHLLLIICEKIDERFNNYLYDEPFFIHRATKGKLTYKKIREIRGDIDDDFTFFLL